MGGGISHWYPLSGGADIAPWVHFVQGARGPCYAGEALEKEAPSYMALAVPLGILQGPQGRAAHVLFPGGAFPAPPIAMVMLEVKLQAESGSLLRASSCGSIFISSLRWT